MAGPRRFLIVGLFVAIFFTLLFALPRLGKSSSESKLAQILEEGKKAHALQGDPDSGLASEAVDGSPGSPSLSKKNNTLSKKTPPLSKAWKTRRTRKVQLASGPPDKVFATTYRTEAGISRSNDETDWWDKFDHETYETGLFDLMKSYLSLDRNYIEFGSWIGPSVLYASKKAGRVYSVEIDPLAFDEQRANVGLQSFVNYDKVSFENKCIHPEPGIYEFRGNGMKGQTFLVGSGPQNQLANERKWQVACTDLFEWLSRLQVVYPTLIRVDLNGLEALLVKDLRSYIRNLILSGYAKPSIILSVNQANWPFRVTKYIMEIVVLYSYAFEVQPGITDHTTLPYDSPLRSFSATAGAGATLVDEAKLGGSDSVEAAGGPAQKPKSKSSVTLETDAEEEESEFDEETSVLHYKLRRWETSLERICQACTYLLTDRPPQIPPRPIDA